MSDAVKQTMIEQGTDVDGTISSRGAVVVGGRLKGEVLAPELTVLPSGSVNGQIKVERLSSQGEISGRIEAEVVELSGKVGDQTVITTDKLEVKLSDGDGKIQVTFGTCELRVGDKRPLVAEKPKETRVEERVPVGTL
jgi:cytoskeletal protein CcmA (bactofilin family)